MIALRPTVESDLEGVSRVLGASYSVLLKPDYPADVLSVIVPLISRAKPELLASGTYFCVEQRQDIIAVGGWTKTRPGTNEIVEGLGHIRHVATDPRHLLQGAAAMIMQRCLREARLAGLTGMECLSTKTAVPFYARFGFTFVDTRDVIVAGVPFASVEMKLLF